MTATANCGVVGELVYVVEVTVNFVVFGDSPSFVSASAPHMIDEEKLGDFDDYLWLVSSQAEKWLSDTAASSKSSDQQQQLLRKSISATRARLVVQQVEYRRKAVEKFGDLASQMFFTDLGLQQSTDRWVAGYKARRYRVDTLLTDYCCGIGGDLIALAARGHVLGWDKSPICSLFSSANCRAAGSEERVTTCVGAVEEQPPQPLSQWHIDPDRRTDGRRSTNLAYYSPSGALLDEWLGSAPHAGIKLAPAEVIPTDWENRCELEWISFNRQCRQLVAWFGDLAKDVGKRRATLVTTDANYSFVGGDEPPAEIANEIGSYVYDTDPAVRAAKLSSQLAASLGCQLLTPGEAYFTSEQAVEHPLLSRFEVTCVLPLRLSALAKELNSRQIGRLEVKTRGVSTNPEQIRSKGKLTGSEEATLLLTRLGRREIAIIAKRALTG